MFMKFLMPSRIYNFYMVSELKFPNFKFYMVLELRISNLYMISDL